MLADIVNNNPIVQQLLAHKANIEATDRHHKTAMYCAIAHKENSILTAKFHCRHGVPEVRADPNQIS